MTEHAQQAAGARTLRIGSRGSRLALWQANHISAALRAQGHSVEIEIIKTTGDRMQDASFAMEQAVEQGGKGIFIKEIEEELAAGRIDLAVHSLKDLPSELDPRFVLAAIPARADARDVLVMATEGALASLPQGARIGTTSPRRQAQLLRLRGDLEFMEMRGNVDTRLRKLAGGQADALVLAAAGLDRLGRTEWVRHRFEPEEMCPAPGQGALAIETRAGDEPVIASLRALDDSETRFCVEAERTVLHELGGGCSVPIGAYCAAESNGWRMWGCVVASDGSRRAFIETWLDLATDAAALGKAVAAHLLEQGARAMLG